MGEPCVVILDARKNLHDPKAKCYGWVPRGVTITNADSKDKHTYYGWTTSDTPTGPIVSTGYIYRDPIAGQQNLAPQYIVAHEIGHTLPPVNHVATGNCPASSGHTFEAQFPNKTGSIGEYGFSGSESAQQAYVPARTTLPDPAATRSGYYDLMAYCGVNDNHQWISPYTFRSLYDAIGADDLAQAASSAMMSSQEYLIASGTISPDGSVNASPFYREAYPIGTNDSFGSGSFSIELQDAQGNVLFTRFFDQSAAELPAQGSPVDFFEVLPFISGTSQIRIKHNTTVLTEISANVYVPQVTILAPSSGQTVTDTMEIRWNANDADDHELHYMVEYSIDDGNTWRTIGFDLTATSLVVKTSDLPGTTEAKIRVLASDGFNTGIGESGLFKVPQKPPQVTIRSPQNGAVITPGQWIHLSGLAEDSEDGLLVDSALVWTLDGVTHIGMGRQLTLFDLSSGNHRITLTAMDNSGIISRDNMTIFVGYKTHLPLVMIH